MFKERTALAILVLLSVGALACTQKESPADVRAAVTVTPASPQATASSNAGPGTPPLASTAPPATPVSAQATVGAAQSGDPPVEFLTTVANALERNDIDTLVRLTKESELDCTANCPAAGCTDQQCGKVRRGIPMGPWASEFSLVSRQDFPGTLTRFLANPQTSATDEYGPGTLRLYGVGTGNGRVLDAVATLIQPDGRRVVLLRLGQDQGAWAIQSIVLVGTGFVDQVLSDRAGYRMVRRWP